MPRGVYAHMKLMKPKVYPPELVKKVAELYATGLSQTEVGKQVGVSRRVVSTLMQNHGILSRFYTQSASYSSTHHRIVRLRGSASERLCPCGDQAKDWAYMHTDTNQVQGRTAGGRLVWFSLNPDHYQALCRRCHARLDSPRGTRVHPDGGGE